MKWLILSDRDEMGVHRHTSGAQLPTGVLFDVDGAGLVFVPGLEIHEGEDGFAHLWQTGAGICPTCFDLDGEEEAPGSDG